MSAFDIELRTHHGVKVGAWRTDTPITVSQGYGGHPIAARPKKAGLTVWEGRQPFLMSVPLLLSLGGESVEGLRILLEGMATSVNDERPPEVFIKSNLGPLPLPAGIGENAAWWIEDMTWGEERRRASDGELTWKLVTPTLLEKVGDQLLETGKPEAKLNRARAYRVKTGDTLHSIAARELGDPERWREIGQLNHIRSDGQLKAGMILHIPARGGIAQPITGG